MAVHSTDDRLVAGRYVRRERLGHGGFGVVWRAHDTLLQRDVAVKEIEFPPILEPQEQATLREKVLKEARAAARLTHPGLVTVFDVVEEDGRPLIVMELVEAPTVAQLVERGGPLPDDRVATIGAGVLEALTAAHEHGIIHRDVKPANVMVHESGRVQLADFGIASIIDDPKVTSSGQLAGSPSYMAPEQAQNQPASVATDLWGLGATLYYAVEGEPPFEKDGPIATLTSVVADDPRPIRRAEALAALLRDLLAKDPEARPSVEEVRTRLDDVATPPATVEGAAGATDPSTTVRLDQDMVPVAAAAVPETAVDDTGIVQLEPPPPDPPPRPSPPAAAAPAPRPRPARRPPPSSRRASPAVPLGVIGVLVVVVLVALLTSRSRHPTTTTAGTSPGSTVADGGDSTPTSAAPERRSSGGSSATKEWVSYRDPDTGFKISRPSTWSVSPNGTLTDFRDPQTGAYLRVDHITPPGPSPEGAWLTFEPRFAAENANYKRIRIAPTTYKGYKAAIWEYSYTSGGVTLHGADLGFIAGDYGFALNFQTRAEEWERMQPVFEQFKDTFKAP